MSTSTVKLYANARISPRNNFIVDSLSNYLSTLSNTITLSDFQYIKHGLNIEIKLNWDQEELDYHNLAGIKYNYCSILNSDQKKTVYYFITDMEWRGMSTLKLSLSMDTINTFRENDDFYFNDKTKINRQHKDRFVKIAAKSFTEEISGSGRTEINGGGVTRTYTYTYINDKWIGRTPVPVIGNWASNITTNNAYVTLATYGFDSDTGTLQLTFQSGATSYDFSFSGYINFVLPAHYVRKIDLTSEGVTPILYGTHKYNLVDDGRNWYLIYTSTGGSTLRCYICTDEKIDVVVPGSSTITRTSLSAGQYYYILPDDNIDQVVIKTAEGQVITVYRELFDSENDPVRYKVALEYWNDGSTISYRTHKYMDIGLGFFYVSSSDTQTTASLDVTTSNDVTYHYFATSTHDVADILAAASGTVVLSATTETNYSISEVDRTVDGLIKIIKLPYKPVDNYIGFNYDSSNMHMLYLDNLSVSFSHDISESDFNPLEPLDVDLTNIAITDLRSATNESKLYHSDYYQPKFVYDSFSFVFTLERQNIDEFNYSSNFHLNFTASNTINSRFMFTFIDYDDNGLALEDYSNILCIARNNEITILNSAYIDYLRLGYNYEVKSKERQETGQWLGFGLSLVGSVASFAAGASGNALAIAGGITLATSAMAQLVSAVNTTAQAEASQVQKLQSLRGQNTSVYGADDVDLMSKYTGNKGKFMLYQCSDKMKSVLFDLFFYTGYVSGVMGIPDTTSRTRFNFVSCEPVFQQSTLTNIPEDILSDIELKMNAGVTYIHYYNSEWDFDQRYENWETSLF